MFIVDLTGLKPDVVEIVVALVEETVTVRVICQVRKQFLHYIRNERYKTISVSGYLL